VRILSIDGGGFLGLAVGTLLESTEAHFRTTSHERFDLFCGTSTGAIIALGLASGLSASDVVGLYKDLGARLFKAKRRIPRGGRFVRSFFTSKYNNEALRAALDQVFGNRTLGDLRRSGKHAAIPAFCVTNGLPRVFNTGKEPNDTLFDNYRVADVALASSAAPTYFPMVKLRRPDSDLYEVFCDGGVVANHPAVIGFAEAVSRLGARPSDISLLSISTPRVDLSEPLAARHSLSRGLLSWAPRLSSAFIDSGSNIMHQALLRIILQFPDPRPKYVRIELDNRGNIPMDLASQGAIDTLSNIGVQKANNAEVRQALTSFFA
jgi:patatin-like phospholipase/acyl hydrolase